MLNAIKMVEVMTPRPVTIHPNERLFRAKQMMQEHGVRHLPVTLGSELIGILSERDHDVAVHFRYPESLRVFDRMRERPFTMTPDCLAGKALRMMTDFKVEAIPVVTQRRTLNGIFTRHDAIALVQKLAGRPQQLRLAA